FVATRLPTGASGLLLAAILAATMSSMTSGINALAGSLTLDFRRDVTSSGEPRRQLVIARYASLAIGLISTLIAGVVGRLGTIFDITQTLLGVFLGPLLCIAIVAFTPRLQLQPAAAIAALVAGCT